MKTILEDDTLTIYLEGRIDSNNSAETEARLMAAISGNQSAKKIQIDADKLTYISSAGLRVLLKARKKTGKPLAVLNVSGEVYDIFSVTGFTELLDVHRKMRKISVEGCEVIGEGANGKVYRLTKDEMIKVFKHNIPLEAVEAEREASRKAFLLGVPCAIAFDTVKCGDSYGTIYEMFNAGTVAERITADPARLPELAKSSALLLRQLHGIDVPEGQMPRASALLHATIDKIAGYFTPDETAMMHALYDTIPEGNRFVHNDYHAKNIMESNGELMLIDLGDAGAGNPAIDLIHCYMVYKTIADEMSRKSDTMNRNANAKAGNPDDETNAFFGITFRQMREFWAIFIDTYCGGDKVKTAGLEERLAPYANFMHLTLAMSHPLLPEEYRKPYADRLRGEVLTRYDELVSYSWEI
ncbi:MAG: anti-sigma factor antagonist [Synergistaceae bacterium]|nr:anti-sigma factor antagonist [Synergistaceae bacterium]